MSRRGVQAKRLVSWVALGPFAGVLVAGTVASALYVAGGLTVGRHGGYALHRYPIAAVGAAMLGFAGGLVVGVLGGLVAWLHDQTQESTARSHGLIAGGTAGLLTAAFALLQLSQGIDSAYDFVFWLIPIPVTSVVAQRLGALIWKRTEPR